MNNRKEEILNIFAGVIIMALFFFFIGDFSKKNLEIHPSIIQNQINPNNQYVNAQAVLVDCISQSNIKVSNVEYDKQLLQLFTTVNTIYNCQIISELECRNNKENIIKVLIINKLFYMSKHLDAEIPPSLS